MKPQATDDCRTVLKRVGVALIVFGAIDIGVMMYCIAHQISYSSSFNLFAVIDSGGAVGESDETNNTVASTAAVTVV